MDGIGISDNPGKFEKIGSQLVKYFIDCPRHCYFGFGV